MKTLKPLSQETFDETVKSNVDDLGMEPAEALQSAVEEFQMQGFDLKGIIKTLEGGKIEQHPVTVAVQNLQKTLNHSDAVEESVLHGLQDLSNSIMSDTADTLQQNLTVAWKSYATEVVMRCLNRSHPSQELLVATLKLIVVLSKKDELREALLQADAAQRLIALFQDERLEVVTAAVNACVALSTKDEDGKCRFMFLGASDVLLKLLKGQHIPGSLVSGICQALAAFTTADDTRPPASKAFSHARKLAADGSLSALLQVLNRLEADDLETTAAVLLTVQKMAANDEICKDFLDEGGVMACLQALRTHMTDNRVAYAGSLALRQLLNSDSVKRSVAANHGLEVVASVLSTHIKSWEVVEAALGAMTNCLLRSPEISTQAAALGFPELFLEAMTQLPTRFSVQRQGCMVIRNMVVRNPELRPVFLEKGAEAIIRTAKKNHPTRCDDVGSAALRDLGIDNYNS